MRSILKKNSKGFTLVELLVVIAVIAILATAGLLSLRGAQRAGRDAKRVADLRSLQGPLEIYYSQTNNYPATLATLVPAFTSRIPTDPFGAAYGYSLCSVSAQAAQGYVLFTTLEGSNAVASSDMDGASAPAGWVCAGFPATCDDPVICLSN